MSTSEMIGQSQKMRVTVALLLGAGNAFSTEYEYRDLRGNTLPPPEVRHSNRSRSQGQRTVQH
jgi:hypothetical protein